MTSKTLEHKKNVVSTYTQKPSRDSKTPHEEIMFCIESTNDIVSKILEIVSEKPTSSVEANE